MRNKVVTTEQAARLVKSGDLVVVGSSAGLNCPDAVLRGIGERFRAEGQPRDLTMFCPIAAGDMYGIKGIDHLAQTGLLASIVAGSYPSGPSSLPSPLIWEMLGRNDVAAYNLPSGVMYDMLRDAAAHRPGVLTKVGLGTFVDPERDGGCINDAARARLELVRRVAFDGETWLHYKPVTPKVAIIRGTTADERGNISMEHEGAVLGMVDIALAVRNNGGIVICQVKRVTAAGSIPTQQVHIPSTLVDFVVVDPEQKQATSISYDPAISGETRRPASSFRPAPFSVDKVIARRAAMELASESAVNLGFGISALVPEILIEEGHGDAVTWAIEQGAIGGVPLTGFAFGCAANAQAIFPTPQQFTYFQAGAFDCSLLSFLEVDHTGSVNVSRLAGKPYLTAGAGGFIDITTRPKKLVFSGYFTAGGLKVEADGGRLKIVQDGKIPKFVERVGHVTFDGGRARDLGIDVTYVTERCVIKLREGSLTVVEVAPGVDLERDVLQRAAVPLRVADDLKAMDARLFHEQPMGLKLPLNERVRALGAAVGGGLS
ncbi:MAG TPA: CoA-transferase [Hyphomicrobiaceae bacterium]|nr:CoA-transferase [Hyphomicrobiaceae bacterium]